MEGKQRGVAGGESPLGGVMDRAYTGGTIGGSDAMVLCKSMLVLPISSEENFLCCSTSHLHSPCL